MRRSFGLAPEGRDDDTEDALDPPKISRKDSRAKGKGKATVGATGSRRSRRTRPVGSQVPDVFRNMLETLSAVSDDLGPSRKRRRTGFIENDAVSGKADTEILQHAAHNVQDHGGDVSVIDEEVVATLDDGDDTEESTEFEDAAGSKRKQTEYSGSDDDSDESEFDWEEVDIKNTTHKAEDDNTPLELTLTTNKTTPCRVLKARRKAITKADRILRLEVHKMHLLCLLAYAYRRNWWCNDEEIQKTLEPLLTQRISACFNPPASYTSFGKAESIKKGLALCVEIWRSEFHITERGLRRSFWIGDDQKGNLEPPSDLDPVLDKSDFRAAARKLTGSRDVGAQLLCALFRRAGLDARLVCSLQPVTFSPSAQPVPSASDSTPTNAERSTVEISMTGHTTLQENGPPPSGGQPAFKPPRWLCHVNSNYVKDQLSESPRRPPLSKKGIHESPYPVFWVEVLDTAHLKWIPVNPFDATTLNKSKSFEPPASDPDNNLSYVVAFEDDGIAKDVTRRYANAYNSKTRKNRVESVGGEIWWQKRLNFYSRFKTRIEKEIDTLEDIYLADMEAREPMPRNIADFKGHPTYALERHLGKNEVLVNGATVVGTTAIGKDASGKKKLENVYRRRDVRTVKSADRWFRVGRLVKGGEQPRKIVMRKNKGDGEDVDDEPGTGLYEIQQTDMYEAPPVVNGRLPKNSYGNVDVYVPSMVPPGACHVTDDLAKLAAQIVGVDYADAVTGFRFQGRKGMPVVSGIVVAAEYRAAIDAVTDALHDEQDRAAHDRRAQAALHRWARFLSALRIIRHVDGYREEGEAERAAVQTWWGEDEGSQSEEYMDDGEGGFFR